MPRDRKIAEIYRPALTRSLASPGKCAAPSQGGFSIQYFTGGYPDATLDQCDAYAGDGDTYSRQMLVCDGALRRRARLHVPRWLATRRCARRTRGRL